MQIRYVIAVWLALAVVLIAQRPTPEPAISPPASRDMAQLTAATGLTVWRVYVSTAADVVALTNGGWDVLESRGADYLRILGNDDTAQRLRAQGYRVDADEVIPAAAARAPMTYYYGYHTVTEHEAHLNALVAQRPDLARRITYGASWRKTQGYPDGHDLMALCITHITAGDCDPAVHNTKPRLTVVAGMHARELVPPELAWRWADYLISHADSDPDILALLDSAEMWIIPVANPDGRSIVEQGGNAPLLQRKNANNSSGGCLIPNIGVDLNRNSDFKWGGATSSALPCNQFYKGVSANSEPETGAIEALMRSLYESRRGTQITDAAAVTTTGMVLSLHSDGNLVMLPWDWTSTHSPNDAALRSLAFRMSYYNGYLTGQSSEVLYLSSGTFEDWVYGTLGVPALTVEIGTSFIPAYSLVDSAYWPANRDALIHAAKLARQPYTLGLGPTALIDTPTVIRVQADKPLTISAWIDDQRYGASGTGKPASQAIAQAEYFVDTPQWMGGTPIAMRAVDGSFNTARERVNANLDTRLSPGRHTVYIHGQDTGGNWGPVSAAWVDITPALVLSYSTYLPATTYNPTVLPEVGWIDATNGRTAVAVGDDTFEAVNLPFAFTFYGNTYTSTFVSSNGYVTFGAGSSSFAQVCLPNTALPNNAIYALWDDLAPTGGANGNVYVKAVDADTFVVEWYQAARFGASAHQTFEIVLRSDNSIRLQYQTVSQATATTIGIENATGTAAQQVWCNGSGTTPSSGLTVRLP